VDCEHASVFWEPLDVMRWAVAAREKIEELEALHPRFLADVFKSAGMTQGPSLNHFRLETTALFATVALHHLGNALQVSPTMGRHHDQTLFARVKTLRNVFEHMDETRSEYFNPDAEATRSVKNYKHAHPDLSPWSFGVSQDGLTIGGIVPLNRAKVLIDVVLAEIDAEISSAIAKATART
jgi:hypothetical protein